MSERVNKVLLGYKNLSAQEKQEFVDTLNQYIRGTPLEKVAMERLFESASTVNFSPPPGGGCPCCGR